MLEEFNIMSEEILSLIKNCTEEESTTVTTRKKSNLAYFPIGEQEDGKNLYAIPAEKVKEILRDATVFPLPFVPPYEIFLKICIRLLLV